MGMLRFLKKNKIQICLYALIFISAILIITGYTYIGFSGLIIFVILYFDNKAKHILDRQTSCVYGKDQVRTVNYMVIGDLFNASSIIPPKKSTLYFEAPDRTLEGSFWILKRLFSIVDENNGKIIIAIKRKNISKEGISLFEYSFLSPIYVKILNVRKLAFQRKHPLLYAPIRTMKLLINKRYNKSVIEECPDMDISTFASERNLNIEFRIIE